ncbi:MAG: hypothetical protein ACOC33_00850 [bacterium]
MLATFTNFKMSNININIVENSNTNDYMDDTYLDELLEINIDEEDEEDNEIYETLNIICEKKDIKEEDVNVDKLLKIDIDEDGEDIEDMSEEELEKEYQKTKDLKKYLKD